MSEQLIFNQDEEEAKKRTRRQNYIARAAGAISGAFAGIVTGWHLTRESLLNRLHNQLHQRDWLHSTPDKLQQYAKPKNEQGIPSATRHFFDAPHLPDNKVRQAFDNLCTDKEGLKKVDTAWKAFLKKHDELLTGPHGKNARQKDVLDAFMNKATKNRNILVAGGANETLANNIVDAAHRLELIIKNKEAVLKRSTDKILPEVDALDANKVLDELITKMKHHEAGKAQGLEDAALSLKGHYNKLIEEFQAIESNFLDLATVARRQIFETPLLKELMKAGNSEAGTMGHQLRHADGKLRILLTSASVTVAMGATVWAGIKWMQFNGDKNKQNNNKSYLERLASQREAISSQPSAGINP